MFTARTRRIRETFDTGECFYFKVNDLATGQRGRSDLLSTADWLDGYDQYLFGELERAGFLRAFLWDVMQKGATPEEVAERARKITPPRPGSVRVHNDAEEFKADAPSLNQSDPAEGARLFRNHILGGQTIPEHWHRGGGDVNRAAASEMGEPVFKAMSMRQTVLKHMLEEVGLFVIWRRLDPSGRSAFDPAEPDPDLLPTANFPELTARDTSKMRGGARPGGCGGGGRRRARANDRAAGAARHPDRGGAANCGAGGATIWRTGRSARSTSRSP